MKKFISLVLAMGLVLSLAACGGSKTEESVEPAGGETSPAAEGTETPEPSGDGDTIVIGMALKTLASEYWQYVGAGAKDAAEELGVELKLVGPKAESEIMEQVGMIEDFISQGVDAIAVAPNEVNAGITALTPAIEAGIPVLFVDTDADLEGKTSFIGTGNESAAELGGVHIAGVMEDGKKAVIIRGRLGDLTHDQRTEGYVKGLEANGIEVLDTQPADSQADKAVAVMEDYIQRFGDEIGAVLCTNDEMAIGAYQAISQAGLADKGIKIIGFDGNVSAVEMALAGEIEGSVAQKPYQMGYQGVVSAVKAAKGEPVEPLIDTGADVITKENGEAYLQEQQEMLK